MAPERSHKATKKAGRSRQCPICFKVMESDFNRHMKIHYEHEFICPVPGCGKGFHQQVNLRTHMNTHTGNRQHACPHSWIDENNVISPCASVFRDGSALCRHRKDAHGFEPKNPDKKVSIRFRSAAEQEEDREVYAAACLKGISVPEARKERKRAREGMDYKVPPTLRAPQAPSRPSTSCSRLSASSSSSSSHSSASSSASSSMPSTPGSSHFKAAIPAGSSNYPSDSSSLDYPYAGAAQPSASAYSWQKQQPQAQNFADVLGQPNMLFPGQFPTHQYGMQYPPAPAAVEPGMDWGIQDWSLAFSDPLAGMDMGMGMGLNAGMGMGLGMHDTISFDMPPFPIQESFGQPSMVWPDAYLSAPSPTSTASTAGSSPPHTGAVFDDFYQYYSA
ncbi:hypothetical protein BV20DRAFT_569190 [Pilatotrama ljubarskyi]|nr:hypothetical protein BV20DRAFT_569190 [Pilatotrama ljubarskyi]